MGCGQTSRTEELKNSKDKDYDLRYCKKPGSRPAESEDCQCNSREKT